jgi:hypothetical protein
MRGDRQNKLKILAPLFLRETSLLIPLSTEFISLKSPFKGSVQQKLTWVESDIH